jgi:2-polyprenyl-3-methyl-5-hydroxy-6-metoxy-1,4-benzoquinol methylase
MRSEELRCCPACGQRTPQRFCYSKWGYDIVRCCECGLGSTVLEKNFDPGVVYNESYFAGGRRDGYADYVGSEKVLRREFLAVLRAILASGAARGKLVEIGCAYGYFLHVARSRFDVFGLDLCAEAVQFARAAGLDVVCGPASEEVFADKGPFDVAVMLDVIEHLPKPAEVLTLIHRHLSAEGRLVLTTGDWGAPISRLMGGAWRLMTPPQHMFFFTRESMFRLVDRTGFEVVSFVHPWKRVPLSLVLYQLARMAGITPRRLPWLKGVGVTVNLFDAMRIIAVKRGTQPR